MKQLHLKSQTLKRLNSRSLIHVQPLDVMQQSLRFLALVMVVQTLFHVKLKNSTQPVQRSVQLHQIPVRLISVRNDLFLTVEMIHLLTLVMTSSIHQKLIPTPL